mmetsp:Transcript_7505/g.18617  ORF Transcript_7505/g.18617 Transcript_7505/m.18617 type:complete len:218 (-) Transcript_7505:1462-2115(-)
MPANSPALCTNAVSTADTWLTDCHGLVRSVSWPCANVPGGRRRGRGGGSAGHIPSPDVCPILSMNAPAITDGAMMNTTGSVPRSIWKTLHLRIPAVTDTGQSGPPTRIHILGRLRPGVSKIRRMARMVTELTPTRARTHTRRPSVSPMPFCCITAAESLMPKQKSTATVTAATYDSGYAASPPNASRKARSVRMMPPVMYTGKPGMKGLRNMVRPTR